MRFPPILLYKWLPKSTMVTGLGSSLAKGGRGEGPKAWGGGWQDAQASGKGGSSVGEQRQHSLPSPNPCSPWQAWSAHS